MHRPGSTAVLTVLTTLSLTMSSGALAHTLTPRRSRWGITITDYTASLSVLSTVVLPVVRSHNSRYERIGIPLFLRYPSHQAFDHRPDETHKRIQRISRSYGVEE